MPRHAATAPWTTSRPSWRQRAFAYGSSTNSRRCSRLPCPRDPTFPLAQLWTARARLVAHGRLAGPDSAQPVLDALLARVMLLRSVVERETRPDDPARKALLFHVTPRATRELPPLAGEILAGAREVRGRFEAMTDGLLAAVESARSEAEAAVSAAQRRERATAAARALTGDQRQLALDLLMHGMDKIANAAVVQLHRPRPAPRRRAQRADQRARAERAEGARTLRRTPSRPDLTPRAPRGRCPRGLPPRHSHASRSNAARASLHRAPPRAARPRAHRPRRAVTRRSSGAGSAATSRSARSASEVTATTPGRLSVGRSSSSV